MVTKFMKLEKDKTSDLHTLMHSISDKINLKRIGKYVIL